MNITNEAEIAQSVTIEENNSDINMSDKEALDILLKQFEENTPTR